MPTKNQAKAAIDAAAVDIKADIDNILPVGVNITDGKLEFAPTRWYIKMLAPDEATADSWRTTITTNLTGAGRTNQSRKEEHYVEDITGTEAENVITIKSQLAVYQIFY